jgi:asparagine synthase (glutamine-hydrolysing)
MFMCGLTGIFEYKRPTDITKEQVHRMNETIVHRGPDDEGVFVGPGVGLGFRRLSIIDVAGGHQPISNEEGTIWVMLNGEIYNYPELRKELLERGHTLATRSDTETIVHLYEEYGESCVSRLRGMFAIVLWDSKKRKLLLARDRVGKKPLFYAADKQRIIFGSELKALLAGDGFSREMDLQALSDYFSFGYIPAPKTIYQAVRKVLPGHYVLVSDDGTVQERCYWNLTFGETESRSEKQWCECIREQLSDAIRVRLMSDVPLGAFLSGGVDSSAVVAGMAGLMNQAVTTCSIGFDDPQFDESKHARQVAVQFHTDHHDQVVRPEALTIVDKLTWHYDEPFADSSAIPTYYVSRIARQKVTVALGGDGGDENFAGYRRYVFDRAENNLRALLPAAVRSTVFGPLGRCYPALAWAPRVFRAKATFQSLSRNPLEGYFNSISVFRCEEKQKLFTQDFRRRLKEYDSIEVLRHHYERAGTTDPLSRIQYVDIKTYLPDDILAKVDRASMAVSLEVRAPLLDHRFMEMLARIPSSLKLRGRQGKYIFKKAMEPVLSPDTLYRPKQGFAVPLARWFREDLKEMARQTIFGVQDGILDLGYLEKIWSEHQRNTFDRSAYLWSVFMFRNWQQRVGAGVVQ